MGESSACLMRSFSQPSSSFHDTAEGDPIRALTSSISFGRYMSESLAWEKWSTFTHNRYMEEVEKYSRPGSVAEMKAHFEAHYKRKAAERAAALCEKQNAAANSTSETNMKTEKLNDSPMDQDLAPKDNHVAAEETQRVEAPKYETDFSVEVSECSPRDEGRELEDARFEEAEQPILAENQVELPNQLENVEDAGKVMSNQGNKTNVKDGAILGDSASSDKKKSVLSSNKSTGSCGVPKPPAPPKSKISPNKSTGSSGVPKPPAPPKPTISLPNKSTGYSGVPKPPAPPKPTISLPNKSTGYRGVPKPPAPPKPKISLPNKSTGYSGVPKPPGPPKPTISLPNRTNINASPNCKKTAEDSTNRKRETPRSLHMSINFASRETNKPLSPILQKIVNSRLVKTLAKASKDRTTQQTPTRASVDISKLPTVKNRSRTPLNQSMSESGKVEGTPCIGASKSPSVCGRKARSPIVSYSFSFKSEERAAKRKEFFERLEQRLQAKETEKEQLQAKLKEKARCDYKDIHLSATSKPIPNLKFSQGTESPSDPVKKVPPMRPCSPKLGRRSTPSKSQDINSRPPWRLTAKTDGCNDTKGKTNRATACSAKSVSKNTMHENASPNIQL